MKQQINLYEPRLGRTRPLLSGVATLQAAIAMALGLGGIYGYSHWLAQSLRADVMIVSLQRDNAARRLGTGAQQLKPPVRDATLAAKVATLEQLVEQREALTEVLAQRVPALSQGLSGFLEGLARQNVPGLWVTALRVGDGGRELSISGRARSPDLVPTLVQRLADEAAFAGMRFNVLAMERIAEARMEVNFVLATSAPSKG